MRVAYIGNFAPAHSTENEVRRALELLGHDVLRYQENDAGTWCDSAIAQARPDLVLWTRTWSIDDKDAQLALLEQMATAGIPTVGFHLDRWWGLDREHQVHDEPFFRCSVVFTADGGHDAEFAAAGVKHVWLPPAVSEIECRILGRRRREFASEIAFVGTWRGGYHAEWQHRPELVEWLRRTYRGRVRFWPPRGAPSIRGERLSDLYASTVVNVGDSCLAGGATRYWSDRIPETLGRGGFLLHPYVDGLADHFPLCDEYLDGALDTWAAGDWDGLKATIDFWLSPFHVNRRERVAAIGRQHVLDHHTYTHRMRTVLAHVGVAA